MNGYSRNPYLVFLIVLSLLSLYSAAIAEPVLTITLPQNSESHSLLFDSTQLDFTSVAYVRIWNSNPDPLIISRWETTGDFRVVDTSSARIEAGHSMIRWIEFTPSETGNRKGVLTLYHNLESGFVTATLDGYGSYGRYFPDSTVTVINPNPAPGVPWTPIFPIDPYTSSVAPLSVSFDTVGTNPTSISIRIIDGAVNALVIDATYLPVDRTICRFYRIAVTGGRGYRASIQFAFSSENLPAGIDNPIHLIEGRLYVGRWQDTTLSQLYEPTISLVAPCRWSARIDGIEQLALFTISGPTDMSMNGINFYGIGGNREVRLHWRTPQETNVCYYRIEKFFNGGGWGVIGRVASRALGGTSTTPLDYDYSDTPVTGGVTLQYRLSMVSRDSTLHTHYLQLPRVTPYSTPAEEEITRGIVSDFSLSNYPNPFNAVTTIEYSIPLAGVVTVDIVNALGQVVSSLTTKKQSVGIYQITFDGSDLSSGIYFSRLRAGNVIRMQKLVMVK